MLKRYTKNMKSNARGFSIIEVVLVLGIAGLIFMMVFVALPSLWASQRDADRKSKTIEFISAVKTYQTNNARGALPQLASKEDFFSYSDVSGVEDSTWRGFVNQYITSEENLTDPTGNSMKIYVTECLTNNTGTEKKAYAPCAYAPVSAAGTSTVNVAAINASTFPTASTDYNLYVFTAAICDGDQAVRSNSIRNVAAIYVLERAGRYCYSTSS